MPKSLLNKLFILLFCFTAGSVFAQSFTASLNRKSVALGEYFIITFSINTNASNFRPPDFKDFDIYSGPNQSTSMSITNGSVSQTISLSYYLVPKKEGKFTIGPAKITANGSQLQSNNVTIEVVKGSSSSTASSSSGGNNSGNEEEQYGYSASGSGDDMFIRTSVSKQKCFMGEQLLVSQKIYSLYQIRGINNYKAPTYNGFWSKEEDRNAQLMQKTENIDGTNYYVLEFNKSVIFPQKSGQLTIDPAEADVVASIQTRRKPRSIFEQFFGSGYEDKVYKIKSKPITITVAELPEAGKPENFTGAVGSFSIKTETDRNKVKENEAITLKMVVSGRGNINLISNPKIKFPAEFETYDPKVSENVNVGGSVTGSKTFEYLIIPRKRGNYTISNLGFSYFDTDKKQYITMPSPEINVTVEPGVAGANNASVYTPSNEVEAIENDIRYIKRGDLQLQDAEKEFFSSPVHYSLLGGCMLLFAGLMVSRRRYIKANSDIVLVKERKAAKLARKKLSAAERLKNENKKEDFYMEISSALNKYISDKMNIPVASLSRDSIAAHMQRKNISDATRERFIKTLDNCEYARFAPAAVSDNLSEIYSDTVNLITEIEEQSKTA